jgi:hypothetical protein
MAWPSNSYNRENEKETERETETEMDLGRETRDQRPELA